MGAANNQNQQAAQPPLPNVAYDLKNWMIHPKIHSKFDPFNGKPDSYRLWSSRIKDHLSNGYYPWARVLELIERERHPMSFARMRATNHVDGVPINMCEIAQHLWSFLGMHLDNHIYMRRSQLVDGEDGNGLELLRKLYMEYEGGAEQVHLAGISRFMSFDKCPNKNKLATYLGEWEMLRMKYGSTFPDLVLYTMLLNILPDDVAKEVRDRRNTLYTVGRVLDYLKGELSRYRDTFISQLHSKHDAEALAKGPHNPVNSLMEKQMAQMHSTVQGLVAAFKGKGKGTYRNKSGAGKWGSQEQLSPETRSQILWVLALWWRPPWWPPEMPSIPKAYSVQWWYSAN